MKIVILSISMLTLFAMSRGAWGHGIPMYLSPDQTSIGVVSELPFQGNQQTFIRAFDYSNPTNHSGPLDTDHGNPFAGDDLASDDPDNHLSGYQVFPDGTTYTYQFASSLYFSNGGTAVPAYVDPTNPNHVSQFPDASIALVFANVNDANPPLYSLYGNRLPVSFSIQANQDGHELDKELFNWASSQGNGVYGFAFTVTATLPDSTTVTTAPLVDVFASPDFSGSASLDAAAGAIVTEVTTSKWSGAGGNANWSTSANWSRAPLQGMNLVFSGTVQTHTTNDSLSSAGTITFDNTAASFTLSGSTLALSGGITNNSPHTQTVNLNLKLSASQQMNAAAGALVINGAIDTGGKVLTATGSANTTLAGPISGSGEISMTGSGTLTLSGDNSYTGGTTVSSGTVVVGNVNGLGSATVGTGLVISNSATTILQAGLNEPVELPGLLIDGGNTSSASALDITDNHMLQAQSGLNSGGDFKYSGGVNSTTDYELWSTGFAHQGAVLSGNSSTGSPAPAQPVPEPAGIVLGLAGLFAATCARRGPFPKK